MKSGLDLVTEFSWSGRIALVVVASITDVPMVAGSNSMEELLVTPIVVGMRAAEFQSSETIPTLGELARSVCLADI